MSVFLFGLGFTARALAHRLMDSGVPAAAIAGTTRSLDKSKSLAAEGMRAHPFDGSGAGAFLAPDLLAAGFVVSSITPGPHGDPVLAHHGEDLKRAPELDWLCYLSTVGVYGDHDGAWIDETTPVDLTRERAARRLAAEESWRELADGCDVPLMILRLAGIYGPGRSAFDKLRTGRARQIVKPRQVFNRIHVEDIVETILCARDLQLAGTFNLTDDEPAPPQTVLAHAAELIDMPPPDPEPFETAELSEMARSFYASNRRVANAAIKKATGRELTHPTYRDGLAAILADEAEPDIEPDADAPAKEDAAEDATDADAATVSSD